MGSEGGRGTYPVVKPLDLAAGKKAGKSRQRRANRIHRKVTGKPRRNKDHGQGERKGDGEALDGGHQGGSEDPFGDWVGKRLELWQAGRVPEEGGMPLLCPGTKEGTDAVTWREDLERLAFDPVREEIEFPQSLASSQRKTVHVLAMKLGLFHASAGTEKQRCVIVSKTGNFRGKDLTRGGRLWYVEGVVTPRVERFALRPGYLEDAAPFIEAQRRFREGLQVRGKPFSDWLRSWGVCCGLIRGSCGSRQGEGGGEGESVKQARLQLMSWPGLEETPVELVSTPDQLTRVLEELEDCDELGFDVEAHTARTYHGLTCLLQLSTVDKDYIVDPLAGGMWEKMCLLRGVFADPRILKIGHAMASCDVPCLFRDFGIVMVNTFDTGEAARVLGERRTGLASLIEQARGISGGNDGGGGGMSELKSRFQACDWRERPLSEEKLTYARNDSRFLIPLSRLMCQRMLAVGTAGDNATVDTVNSSVSARAPAPSSRAVPLAEEAQGKEQGNEEELDGGGGAGGGSGCDSPNPPLSPPPRRRRKDVGGQGDQGTQAEGVSSAATTGDLGEFALPLGVGVAPGAGGGSGLEDAAGAGPWGSPEDCHGKERRCSGSFYRPLPERRREVAEAQDALFGSEGDSTLDQVFGKRGDQKEEDDCRDDRNHAKEVDEDEEMWADWGVMAEVGGREEGAEMIANASASATVASAAFAAAPAEHGPDCGLGSGPSRGGETHPVRVRDEEENQGSGESSGPSWWEDDPLLCPEGVQLLWMLLMRAQKSAAKLWKPTLPLTKEDAHRQKHFRMAAQKLGPPRWTGLNLAVFEEIFLWRDGTARRLDEGPTYVCSGQVLIDVALALPTTVNDLRKISMPVSPVLGNGDTPEATELLQVVKKAVVERSLPRGRVRVKTGREECAGMAVTASSGRSAGRGVGGGGGSGAGGCSWRRIGLTLVVMVAGGAAAFMVIARARLRR